MTRRGRIWLIVLGLILAGANLRLPITMMPPLLPALKAQIGLPTSLAGLLTTIPLLMFALVSPFMGRFGSRHGNELILVASIAVLCVGSYLRIIPSPIALIAGTAIVGIGITGGNVLLPAVIKERFPDNVASMTTLYTTTMGLVASIGTATSGPLAGHVGSQGSMALIALVGPVALVVWLIVLATSRTGRHHVPVAAAADRPMADKSPWRAPLAWIILLYFGLQSVLYYSLVTWLPGILEQSGFSASTAANLATVFQLSGMPLTLTTPWISERKHGLVIVNGIVGGGFALGMLGLLIPGGNVVLATVCAFVVGAASGAAFSISVVFFQKRTSSASDTARLSGMAQSGGYVIAAIGPTAFGMLESMTRSWTPVIGIAIVLALVLFGAGVVIIRHRDIYEDIR